MATNTSPTNTVATTPVKSTGRHLPSCQASRHWRKEPTNFSVIPTSTTNSSLLQEFGFQKPVYCWYGTLTVDQAESLMKRMKKEDGELRPVCGCYNPTMSEAENEEWRKNQEAKELQEGWKEGKPW